MAKTETKNIGFLILRLILGIEFLWAFFDKLFGLGFATCRDKASGAVTIMCKSAWINGGSPTTGFLKFGATGMLGPMFSKLAGIGIVDWLFMLGLLGIGISLLSGAGLRIGSYGGAVLMIFMFLAAFKPFSAGLNNPFFDEHIIIAAAFLVLTWCDAGDVYGLGKWWKSTKVVKMCPWLA